MNERHWPAVTPGIPDHWFERGPVPMTKEEIRVMAICKLRPGVTSRIWDIGAGTGSLAVEAALLAAQGHVWAVEREADACRLISANASNFNIGNLTVVEGEAPDALADLPAPDGVLVGGSGGKLAGILKAIYQRLQPGGRVVITAITLETLSAAVQLLEEWPGAEVEVTSLQVTRRDPGKGRLLRALNPVYLIRGVKSSAYR